MSGGPRRRVAMATGSRAEFGLLAPVMRAVRSHAGLELTTIVAGAHLLPPAETWRDIERAGFEIAARVPMQVPGDVGRLAEAVALGRGVEGFARVLGELRPDWVVVLGDRIEAFAAASAAAVGGLALAHIHGGDRAEGIADESMRHAISRLAHLHCAASACSAERLRRMGEAAHAVHHVGSPAVDGLDAVEAMSDEEARSLGDPAAIILMHPSGSPEEADRADVRGACAACAEAWPGRSILCLDPNHDAGREAVLDELDAFARTHRWPRATHLPRARFLSLLKRLAARGGMIVGNSSAGLIESAALRLPAVNIGPRQAGRERPPNVVDAPSGAEAPRALRAALSIDRAGLMDPFGDGRASIRIADLLARVDPRDPALLRKRCAY